MTGFGGNAAGRVVFVHVAARAEETMGRVEEARAVPGPGLEGDRYFRGGETFSDDPDTEITLSGEEAVEALAREHGLPMVGAEARRNVVTRGVDLDTLVGREFRVGGVAPRGCAPARPCAPLARLVGSGVLQGLARQGGLQAEILSEGIVRAGDAVEALSEEPSDEAPCVSKEKKGRSQ